MVVAVHLAATGRSSDKPIMDFSLGNLTKRQRGRCSTVRLLCRAVYELTAVVAHVVDAPEGHPDDVSAEGHLVANVKVSTP